MNEITFVDILVVVSVLGALALVFLSPWLRTDKARATVTPLASIIGSGFLILAPILVREFGRNAVFVMAGLCIVSYSIGAAIRNNISVLDTIGGPESLHKAEWFISKAASPVLTFAYVVSVCYYLNLLGAFFVSLTPFDTPVNAKIVTTVSLILVGGIGWVRGLRGLESAEQVSVGVKMAIIAGMLVGMTYHAGGLAFDGALQQNPANFGWTSVRIAFGLLITVQGFETSRYLGEAYDAKTRIATMKYAQWLSTVIYILFIGLASVEFSEFSIGMKETAVIGMMRSVAVVLPFLLVVAALASQFSAAVADTNGCGGLTEELTKGKVSNELAYVLLVAIAVVLTWTANIYEIISYASRVFAGYYALQCLLAAVLVRRSEKSWGKFIMFAILAVLCLGILIFGIPAE